MASSTINDYKARLGAYPHDAHTTSSYPSDKDMPSPLVPFITPSGLMTLQHDLKTRINLSPLVKVPLTMRPLVKKRSSNPFSLTLRRHSTTIFSRSSSSSSDACTSTHCTPTSEKVDPICTTDVAAESSSEKPAHPTPSIGTKIVDRFWPEDEALCSAESFRPAPSCYATALAPPPHHRRRAPRSLGSLSDVPFSSCTDPFPSRTGNERNTGPLRFPF